MMHWKCMAAAVVTFGLGGGAALADSISPTSFTADLAVGESVTVAKTVTISAGGPTDALLDVMFVFDTTGSMGSALNTAKAAAVDILDGLSAFGNLHSGAGFYNDPDVNGVVSDLTANDATTIATINGFFASGGGDFPELGFAGISQAADEASWRPGSNRFIVAFGDASFKAPPDQAATLASLAANSVDLIGLSYDSSFADEITGLGGTVFPGSTDPDDVVDAILAGVSGSFDDYSTVTVGDLGAGLPEIAVSAVCTGADIGTCVGADATGTFDRSEDRTFTFDVTFTRMLDGDKAFGTFALVDGGIVATEADTFSSSVAPIPLPAAAWLMLVGLTGFGFIRRRAA